MGREAAKWIASRVGKGWVAELRLAFHDREEMGPRMLARISKSTGLTPDDL